MVGFSTLYTNLRSTHIFKVQIYGINLILYSSKNTAYLTVEVLLAAAAVVSSDDQSGN